MIRRNGGIEMKKFIFMISENLHKQMKTLCAKEGMSMKDYLSSLIENDLKNRGAK